MGKMKFCFLQCIRIILVYAGVFFNVYACSSTIVWVMDGTLMK